MPNGRRIYRHRFWVRMTHWVNVVCMTVLLMSGLQIFNAHPALYWGNISHFDNPVAAIGTFPDWVTLPGSQWLAMGRRWHFFFAWLFVTNGALYALLAIASGHFHRDLVPTPSALRQIGHSIRDHLRLRFPKGEEARHYNVLQRLAFSRSFACCVRSSSLPVWRCRRNSTPPIPGFSPSSVGGNRRARSIFCAPSPSSAS